MLRAAKTDTLGAERARRLRIFRAIYAVTSLGMSGRALAAWRNRRRQLDIEMREETLQGDAP